MHGRHIYLREKERWDGQTPNPAMSVPTTVPRFVTLADGSKVPALAFGTGPSLVLW